MEQKTRNNINLSEHIEKGNLSLRDAVHCGQFELSLLIGSCPTYHYSLAAKGLPGLRICRWCR